MISIRIQMFISGYKRQLSNTDLLRQDLMEIEKLIKSFRSNTQLIKIRNKFLDILEIFELCVLESYIEMYHTPFMRHDSQETWKEVLSEIKTIKRAK